MKNSKAASAMETPREGTDVAPSAHTKSALDEIRKTLKPLASLQVAIVLFFFALLLVFFGTLAQMNEGIWTVVDKYFRSGIVWVPFQLLAKFGMIFFEFGPETRWSGSFPLPGGYLLGWLLLINLLAAHFVRFRLTWKRSGIILAHAGIVVLLVGEFVTRECAVESTMTLVTGETGNFVDETLTVELAISNSPDGKINDVVKVPGWMLKQKGLITHNELPVDIEVLEYWKNSELDVRRGPAPDDSWTNLDGNHFRLVPRSEESGVDTQKGDAPAVRVNLRKKGTDESVAQFFLSLCFYPNATVNSRRTFVPPFQFTIEGTKYTVQLRNKRTYKPYSIHLLKFEHAVYPGTEIPKDFASTVEIVDPQEGSNREYRIYMNNPLRYREDNYYQSMVLFEDTGTVLQVVRNPGRLMPYIACALVFLGLSIHFGMALNGFLKRRLPAKKNEEQSILTEPPGPTPIWNCLVPLGVVVLAAAWLVSKSIPPSPQPGKIDYYELGKLPVLQGGRLKPLDTVARTNLQAISGKSEVQDEDRKFVASAVQWYVDVFDSRRVFAGKASEYKVFRIDNDQLLTLLDLKPRPEFFRYSLKEIKPKFSVFKAELNKIQQREDKIHNLRDTKILDLGKKIQLYLQLAHGKVPALVPPQSDGEEWQTMASIDLQIPFGEFTEQEHEEAKVDARDEIVTMLEGLNLTIEDLTPAQFRIVQQMFISSMPQMLANHGANHRASVNAPAAAFTQMMRIAKTGDVQAFNDSLSTFRNDYLKRVTADEWSKIRYEAIFNHFAPFYLLSFLYVFVIILAILSWLGFRTPLLGAAFWLGVLTLGLHAFAIITRMYLQGRPPVTNLYSSAVFIGWGCMALCLLLERFASRNGMGLVVGGTLGALSMMVAHHLAEGGDTMEMLQAVLDTDFWLATHVTCVTMGYMATFVAGFIALLCVGGSIVFTVRTSADNSDGENFKKICYRLIYGVICFATLLSFTGTVLGGLWADYSWGRFWGWDSKENGAVMVVIWNTLILHARWAGLIKLHGMTILALVGNMITFWSWFGTNQLQIGLHSYGFSPELAQRCCYFWIASCIAIAAAALPLPFWSNTKRPGKQLGSR